MVLVETHGPYILLWLKSISMQVTAEARQLVPRAKSPSPALSSITTDSNHNEGDEGLKMQVNDKITADRKPQGIMESSCY